MAQETLQKLGSQIAELKSRRDFSSALSLLAANINDAGGSPELLVEAGLLAKNLKRHQEAVSYFRRAEAANPNFKGLGFEIAAAILDTGDIKFAEAEARKWLQKEPKDFALNNLLGVVLRKQGRYSEALEYLKAARKAGPKSIAPLINLGNTYLDIGDGKNAEVMYSQVVRLAPKDSEHMRMLGRAENYQGFFQKSITSFRRSLMLNPANTEALNDLMRALAMLGKYDEALKEVGQKLAAYPDKIETMAVKAWVLYRMANIEEAVALYERILEINPNYVDTLLALGRLYEPFNREKSNGYYMRAADADNRSIKTLTPLCDGLNRSRYGKEAEHIQHSYLIAREILAKSDRDLFNESSILRNIFQRSVDYESLAKVGDIGKCRDHWLKIMNIGAFHLELSRVKTMEDRLKLVYYHREWGKRIEAMAAGNQAKRKPREARSKIRVGFMSSDLRAHPVTYFALPLFEHYDKNKFEVYCYSFFTQAADNLQEHIMKNVDQFRWWPKKSDQEIAQGIADDDLDILFELGGSTDLNRLQVMAHRPARVQASWLGYPHSAGLKDIDYILVDPYIKPENSKLLLEKTFEMPESWVTLGRSGFYDIPINPVIPEDRNGFITFGTMNNPYKYTEEGIKTWAEILTKVPGSKFLFVRPEGDVPAFRENVEKEFARYGIARERIMYIPIRGKHLPHYNEIDIALDTFPHVGGTTTCETIWMGVPAITLVGPAFYERLSYSNLSNAGLGELCAFSLEEYIEKAVKLAEDKEKRKFLRNNLRDQIKQNPLGQTERFAENFYKTVEKVLGSI